MMLFSSGGSQDTDMLVDLMSIMRMSCGGDSGAANNTHKHCTTVSSIYYYYTQDKKLSYRQGTCGVVCVILCLAICVELRLVTDRHRLRPMASTMHA